MLARTSSLTLPPCAILSVVVVMIVVMTPPVVVALCDLAISRRHLSETSVVRLSIPSAFGTGASRSW